MGQPAYAAPEPANAALNGLCPRCGTAGLFAGLAGFAKQCGQCGLDFHHFNVGDGPAAFLTMIVGAVVVVFAIALEKFIRPPVWVHTLLWPLFGGALTLMLLRWTKGWLLATEYRRGAKEGQIKS